MVCQGDQARQAHTMFFMAKQNRYGIMRQRQQSGGGVSNNVKSFRGSEN